MSDSHSYDCCYELAAVQIAESQAAGRLIRCQRFEAECSLNLDHAELAYKKAVQLIPQQGHPERYQRTMVSLTFREIRDDALFIYQESRLHTMAAETAHRITLSALNTYMRI